MSTKNKIIDEISITKKSKIIISTVKLGGKNKLDIRLWYLGKKSGSLIEEWLPSVKGINVLIDKCSELINGLQKIVEPEEDLK